MENRNGFFNEEQRAKRNRYFSVDFKKKRMQELENNLITVSDICKTYKVSRTSVYRWLYKYSSMAKKQVKQVVEAKSDTKKIQLLEDRIKELERIVGQKQLLIDFQDKMIEIAENTYEVDIKKKLSSKLSVITGVTKKNTKSK
ncbi:MAG: helix-turn-helix domain-containing protein [Flavobacteriaceae bacterium]|nr:helix-turn-helix domain-containing protein [Flavobacteriaceae bacterium]